MPSMTFLLLNFRRILIVLILVFLFGCATPNIKPFAEQTSQLAGSVALEQKSISIKFSEVVEISQGQEKEELKKKKKRFDSYSNIINAVLQKSVKSPTTPIGRGLMKTPRRGLGYLLMRMF